MMLYNVFYHGSAMDMDVPLPPAAPDIERAVNTNWDRHVKVPVNVGKGEYRWKDK